MVVLPVVLRVSHIGTDGAMHHTQCAVAIRHCGALLCACICVCVCACTCVMTKLAPVLWYNLTMHARLQIRLGHVSLCACVCVCSESSACKESALRVQLERIIHLERIFRSVQGMETIQGVQRVRVLRLHEATTV